ncbi:hypothetical protein SCLCIDRAFT_1224412 [Scleroderma citrinum Foug A]|uniref:Uncharacterized protein n=1 Tax=Scleroderma citrinum Foug A TaxID=1036808 RepID=A0A0C3D583_9AGAM|nr:hypothetical protein SCLCIDRAFT_1224412 [Scleroderma citrinum Foug A]
MVAPDNWCIAMAHPRTQSLLAPVVLVKNIASTRLGHQASTASLAFTRPPQPKRPDPAPKRLSRDLRGTNVH